MSKKILLVGESWMSFTTHVKGFDTFYTSVYETGKEWIEKAIIEAGYEFELEALKQYDCIVLSDIGANTLLLPTQTFTKSINKPNRCNLLRDYVLEGGSLLMVGGYMTFAGIDGKGKWHDTAVQEVLPVEVLTVDDRMEHSQGVVPEIIKADHAIMEGLPMEWPNVLGYNKTIIKEEAEVVANICGDPFIAFGNYGKGKSGVFTTDCAPHWAPPEFCNWEYYNKLFANIFAYLTK